MVLGLLALMTVFWAAAPAQAAVKISKTKLAVRKGSKDTLKVTGAKKVTWKSLNEEIVTVSDKGVVKGVAVGTAKVQAKAGKKTLTCTVTVKKVLSGKWKTKKGKKYYLLENGKYATYWQQIGNLIYIFNKKGQLMLPAEQGIVTIGKYQYYVSTKGIAMPGWHVVDNQLFYASSSGQIQKNKTVGGIVLSATGAAEASDLAQYQTVVARVVDGLVTDQMTAAQKLKACWKYLTSNKFKYVSRYPDLDAPHWYQETAADMLQNKKGNCYSFACAFAAMAYDLGYTPWVVCGRVSGTRDKAADGLTRHSWVWIKNKHYDPEGQFKGWYRNCYGVSKYSIRHTIQTYTRYKDGKIIKG